jgi:hypothetical protein
LYKSHAKIAIPNFYRGGVKASSNEPQSGEGNTTMIPAVSDSAGIWYENLNFLVKTVENPQYTHIFRENTLAEKFIITYNIP